MELASLDRAALAELASLTPSGAARELVSPGHFDDPDFVEHISGRDLAHDEMLDVLAAHPNLLKKPLIRVGDTLCVGFNPAFLELLAAKVVDRMHG